MTLIVSYADPHCVIQLSDRRLTFSDGRKTWYEDVHNKAVIHRFSSTIALTGLARLGPGTKSLMTDAWIAQTLQRDDIVTIGDAAEALEQRATQTLGTVNLPPSDKRLTLVITGWAGRDGTMVPTRTYVTNSLINVERDEWLPEPKNRFWHMTTTVRPATWGFATFGSAVPQALVNAAVATIKTQLAIPHPAERYRGVTEALAGIILETAKTGGSVGQTINIVCVPNPAEHEKPMPDMIRNGRRLVATSGLFYRLPDPSNGAISACSLPLNEEQISPRLVGGTSQIVGRASPILHS